MSRVYIVEGHNPCLCLALSLSRSRCMLFRRIEPVWGSFPVLIKALRVEKSLEWSMPHTNSKINGTKEWKGRACEIPLSTVAPRAVSAHLLVQALFQLAKTNGGGRQEGSAPSIRIVRPLHVRLLLPAALERTKLVS